LYRTRLIEETYQLEQMVHNSAEKHDTYNDQWISASTLSRDLPISLDETIRSIDRGYLECSDNFFAYFVSYMDVTKVGTIGPIEYEEMAIRNLILGRRKQDLIKKLEKEVLEEGWRTEQLKVYDQNNE